MNIVFLGTPEFGAIILEKLIQAKMAPVLVVSAPDMPVDRKQILTPPPVKSCILKHETWNLKLLQPKELDSRFTLYVSSFKPDLIVLAAYGRIIPKAILDIPTHGALNVHPSLLPKHRGPSPIQTTILNGDEETGVTLILMDEEIDHGPIIASSKFKVPARLRMDEVQAGGQSSKITYPQLYNQLAELGAKLLIETIPLWIEGKINPVPQDHSKATFTKHIKKEDGRIDWKKPAEYIERQVRAFFPWPGAFTFWKGKRIKILKAHVEQGKLVVDKLQLEGKKPTTLQEFLLGHKDFTLP